MYALTDILRHLLGGEKKKKPAFKTEKAAYDFCRTQYKKSGGVPRELLRAYDFYKNNYNESVIVVYGPEENTNNSVSKEGNHKRFQLR